MKMECKDCVWWMDWSDRVCACISTGHSKHARNLVELRRCKFIPHPSIVDSNPIYTDEIGRAHV